MKKDYPCFKAVILSSILLASIEYCIVLITGDYNSACIWHNTFFGVLTACVFRIILITALAILLYQLFIPKHKTLNDRMIERDEKKNQKLRKLRGSLQLGNYGYETN